MISGDAELVGDERLAVQALFNLGSNAIEACKGLNGSSVALRLVCGAGVPCAIEVDDDGPGIPYSLRPRLFQPFTTGRAQSGGRGLGLFVVRQAVRNLGGNIRVETSTGGTLFRLEFPDATLRATAEA